jgi:GAF domain-containing protein
VDDGGDGAEPLEVFERIQSLLLSTDDANASLVELAVLGASVVGPDGACAITTRYDRHLVTVASSDVRSGLLDESQYADGSGPCMAALSTGTPVSVPDVAQETRWPGFLDVARAHGLGSLLSIPLEVRGSTVGAMNFYAFHAVGAFDQPHQTACAMFAAQASGAIQLLTQNARDVVLVGQLEQALSSRSVIDQALGIVMATDLCTAEQAFATLRARSQASQRKLRDVALELIEQVSGEAPPESRTGADAGTAGDRPPSAGRPPT